MRKIIGVIVTTLALIGVVANAAEPTGRYKDVLDRLNALQAQYPKISSIFSIGTNDDGVQIMAMRISTTPDQLDNHKIGNIIVSTHHGNELAAPEFTLYFTEQLLKRYASSELFRGNLADVEWTIIPVLNVSGYNADEREEHGYDPNRQYPGPCVGNQTPHLKSIQTLMNFMGTRVFTGSLTVHGYEGALTYPWGVSAQDTHTADQNLFDQITQKAAALNGYRYGTSTDIVYPCDGAYEDYSYWKYGMWSLLLELQSGSKSDIEDTSNAIATYFDQLNSSPSTEHNFNSVCNRVRHPDLHRE